jgi:chromosome segregation ATPase
MRTCQTISFISATILVYAGLSWAENPRDVRDNSAVVTESRAAEQGQEVSILDSGWENDSRAEQSAQHNPLTAKKAVGRNKDLEARFTALQRRLEAQERVLARQSEEIQDLRERLDLAEGQLRRANTHLVSFQVNQKERSLNPTESKQIADLMRDRIVKAQKQFQQTIYVPIVQPNWTIRHEEPLYAP